MKHSDTERCRWALGLLFAVCLVGCSGAAAGDGSTWYVEEASGLMSDLDNCDCRLADLLTSHTRADELILSCSSGRSGVDSIYLSLPLPPTNHLRGVVRGRATVNDVYDVAVTAVVELGSHVEAKIHDQTDLDSARHPYRVVHIHTLSTPAGRACPFLGGGDCVDLPAGRLSGYRGFCDAISFDYDLSPTPRPR